MQDDFTIQDAAKELATLLSSGEFALEVKEDHAKRQRAQILKKLIPLAPQSIWSENLETAARVGAAVSKLLPAELAPDGEPGFVYVFTDASGLFKIGRTTSLIERLQDIRYMNPTVHVIAYFKTENAYAVERLLHQSFARTRIVGEWFDLAAYGP